MAHRYLLFLLPFLLLPGLAGASTDSTVVFHRYCLSVQGGPPVRILSTDFIDEDSPGLIPNGRLKRYSYSVGGAFRYYFTPSFSAALRFALVRRDFIMSDSTYSLVGESNDGFVHAVTGSAYYWYNEYTMRNLLVGVSAGYEMPIGRLRVKADAELAYVRYLQIVYNVGSRSYTLVNNDSLANANDYSSVRTNVFWNDETFPNVSSFGLLLQTGLEYSICPHFGFSASFLLGGFYSWVKNGEHVQVTGNSSEFSDSNQQHTFITNETENRYDFSRTQFDFSPPTGLVGLNFYF